MEMRGLFYSICVFSSMLLRGYLCSVPYVYVINTIPFQKDLHPIIQGSSDYHSMSKQNYSKGRLKNLWPYM